MSATNELMLLARVGLSLLVVLGIAVLLARYARRAGLHGQGAGLRVLDRTGLSRDASLAVVEVGGKALLLGVTPHKVSVLSELDPTSLVPIQTTATPSDRPPETRRCPADQDADRKPTWRSALSGETWRLALDALRDLTKRRG